MDDKFLRRPEISSIIRELRGGSWSTALIGNTIFVVVLYGIWLLASGSEGFVQQPNPGWGLGNNLYEPPGLVRPADCETQLYAGSPQQSLKTEASRNQPNAKDQWILVESRPELIIRRGQAQFKTKDHEEENRIAIFKRSTGEFITFCERDEDEHKDLIKTGKKSSK